MDKPYLLRLSIPSPLFSISEWQWRFFFTIAANILHTRTDCDLTLGENDSMTANQFLIAATIPLKPQAVCVCVMSEHVQVDFPRAFVCLHAFLGVCVCLVSKWVSEWLCYGNPVATLFHLVAEMLMLSVWSMTQTNTHMHTRLCEDHQWHNAFPSP